MADYTVIWGNTAIYVKYLMSNILERPSDAYQGFLLLNNAKNIRHYFCFADMIKPGTYVIQHV